MSNRLNSSLRFKILFYFFIVAVILIISIFIAFEEAGKVAFKNMEKEKAQVLLRSIKPAIAMNLYLGFEDKIQKIINDILHSQKNIIGITVVKDNKIIATTLKKEKNLDDYFILSEKISVPNLKRSIGELHIMYSFEHYNNLIAKYKKMLLIFVGGILMLLLVFSLYLDQLLSPLKKIAEKLKTYDGKDPFTLEYSARNDEVGAIAKSLEEMHKKIVAYREKQEEINKHLEHKVQEKTEKLRERLFTDVLTSLPNRAKLQEDLASIKNVTLMILNIDDFKEINDFFGHKMGDKILKDFAKKLQGLFNTTFPKVYRLSGDEFVLLFDKRMTKKDIEHFLLLLMNNIEKMTFFYGDKELNLRVTIGVAVGRDGVLEKADIALKKAKANRKEFEIYNTDDKAVEEQYRKNIEWIKKLKKSIEHDRVVPFFQPIVNVHTLQPKGYESLMRVIDENGHPIAPNEFLMIAKKSRLYFHLSKIMIKKSCEFFKDSNCSYSINLSIEDILNDEIAQYLEKMVSQYNVANRMILEVVESEGIDNYDMVSDFLFYMKGLGCQIAIDDFGSGYSNFEHILKLPLDYIKIDGSLVKNVVDDKDSQIIISSIVELAKRKEIKTISEFVSSYEIFEKIKDLGVDYAQGYYFQKPLPEVDLQCLMN